MPPIVSNSYYLSQYSFNKESGLGNCNYWWVENSFSSAETTIMAEAKSPRRHHASNSHANPSQRNHNQESTHVHQHHRNRNQHSSEALRAHLTKEMMLEVEDVFQAVVDADGHMPFSKLPLCLKALGMSTNETNENLSDYQGEGLSFDKFLGIVIDCLQHPNWAANEMNEAYTLFDKDGNGFIDPTEIKRVFYKIGETLTDMECEDQLRAVDIDGDSQVMNVCRLLFVSHLIVTLPWF